MFKNHTYLVLSAIFFILHFENTFSQCANTYSVNKGKLVFVWTSSTRPQGITTMNFDGTNYIGANNGNYQWVSDAVTFTAGVHDKGLHTIIMNNETCTFNNGVLPTEETRKLLEQLALLKKETEEKARLAAEAEQAKKDIEEKKKREAAEEKAKQEAEEKAKLEEYEQAKRKAQIEADEKRKKEEQEKSKSIDDVNRERAKAQEEKARLIAEEERLKKQSEETLKLLAEIEKLKREADRKSQIINEADQVIKKQEEREKLAVERSKQEAVEKAKREEQLAQMKKNEQITQSANITISKDEADRIKREAAAKADAELLARHDADSKAKADEEARLKKEADDKSKAETEAKLKAEKDPPLKNSTVSSIESFSLSAEECDNERFLDNCQKLVEGAIVQSFNVSADTKNQPEYSVVLSKDNEYIITACSGRNGRMTATVYDRDNVKIIASNYNKLKRTYYSRISFVCPASGVYHIRFSFESEIGCGICILSNKK